MARLLFVKIPGMLLKLATVLVLVCTPLIGFWLASSLATFVNGPLWLPFLAGVLLFPVLPLFWELWASRRRRKREKQSPPFFSTGQRLVMRTMFLNLLFIGGMILWAPQTSFLAISTRGDWMLDRDLVKDVLNDVQRERVRGMLFGSAEGLEWAYRKTMTNPYERYIEDTAGRKAVARPEPSISPFSPEQPVTGIERRDRWPWTGLGLHPAVRDMSAADEVSIESVARYLDSAEDNQFQKVKALHDYVADRVAYDVDALRSGNFPPQDAESVFRSRKSVCAGYANLFRTLGDVVGVEVVVISGNSRNRGNSLSGLGHAWNAVKLEDTWYLVDCTWDAGYVDGDAFIKEYSTTYFLTPPEIIAVTHFPKDAAWQLLSEPLSHGDFLRQPWLKPDFFAAGMSLKEPDRSRSEVSKTASIIIENPHNVYLMAKYRLMEGDTTGKCTVNQGPSTSITCPFPATGTWEVDLLSSPRQYDTYHLVGRLEYSIR